MSDADALANIEAVRLARREIVFKKKVGVKKQAGEKPTRQKKATTGKGERQSNAKSKLLIMLAAMSEADRAAFLEQMK